MAGPSTLPRGSAVLPVGPGPGGSPAPARADALRRHNLARVLDAVHRDGELSRAELTVRLGLNRSTIGTLTGELVAAGLLRGDVPVPAVHGAGSPGGSAGRPSHVVATRGDGPVVVAVDLEVERISLATIALGGEVVGRDHITLPDGPAPPAEAVALIARAAVAAVRAAPGPLAGVGVSVPGSVGRDTGRVLLAPNLGWRSVDLVGRLGAALRAAGIDTTVVLGNDANVAAVAEHVRGRGRGVDDVVFLLGRVGVGAGIITGGRLLAGRGGSAGEIGHLCLDTSGPRCHCGGRGCAETFIGDVALLRAAGLDDAAPSRTQVEQVLQAAAAGSRGELRAVRRVAGHLGRTVAAVLNLVDPGVVIAGGTLAAVLDLAGDRTREQLERFAFGASVPDVVLCTASGNVTDATLLGAAELAFAPLLRDPMAFALA